MKFNTFADWFHARIGISLQEAKRRGVIDLKLLEEAWNYPAPPEKYKTVQVKEKLFQEYKAAYEREKVRERANPNPLVIYQPIVVEPRRSQNPLEPPYGWPTCTFGT